ncbi:MAG: glycosyltransferase family 39 protein [Bacteroidota bacterium]
MGKKQKTQIAPQGNHPSSSLLGKLVMNRSASLLIVSFVAVLIRIIYLIEISSSPFFSNLFSDSAIFDGWAKTIVRTGDWLGDEAFFMAPLYPYFLALMYTVFGHSLVMVRVVQSFIGVISVLFLYLVGERIFNRSVAFVAALVMGVYPVLVYFDNMILVETLQVFLTLLLLYMLLKAIEKPKALWRWAFAGMIGGLSALARPNTLLIDVFAVAWIVIELYRQNKVRSNLPQRSYRDILGAVGFFLGGMAVVIAPVTIRNAVVSHDFVLISSNGGLNFFIGNNPEAPGVYYNSAGFDLDSDPSGRYFAEQEVGHQMRPSEVSSFWMKKGLDFIRKDFGGFLTLLLRKLTLFFSAQEIPQVGISYEFFRSHYAPILRLPLPTFFIVSIFGAIGIYLSSPWRSGGIRLLLLFLVGFVLSIVVIFVADRFRLPVVPILILFGSYALLEMIQRLKRREHGFMLPGIVVASAVVVFEVLAPPRLPEDFASEFQYLGTLYYDAGQFDKAVAAYTRSLSYHDNYFARNNLGNALARIGNIDGAVAQYVQAMRLNPRHPLANFNLGNLFVSIGQIDRAKRSYERSVEIDPRFAPAYRNLAILAYQREDYSESLKLFTRYLSLEKDPEARKTVEQDIARLKEILSKVKR